MPVPHLTHLQFMVLQILGAVERPGRYLREQLAEEGERRSLPAFYQMMSRLEDAGMLKGEDRPRMVQGHQVVERWYKVTARGHSAMEAIREFYRARELTKIAGKGVAHV